MYDKFILIVDDEQELLTLIKTIFERKGQNICRRYTDVDGSTDGVA